MSVKTKQMIYEVVSGQILLSHREQFFELHERILLPMMKKVGIRPVHLLITEVGRYGRFLDIYVYDDFADYQKKTDRLLSNPKIKEYYKKIGKCIHGSIVVELMQELPYSKKWSGS